MKKLFLIIPLFLLSHGFAGSPNDWDTRANWSQKIHNIPEAKNYQIEDAQKFGKEMMAGAIKGDFIKQPTFANLLGNFIVNLTPAGVVSDTRDLSANLKQLFQSGFKENKSLAALSVAAYVPVMGDLRKLKGAYEAGKEAKLLINTTKATAHLTGDYVSKTLPALKKSYMDAFDGKVIAKTFEKGEIIARAPSNPGLEPAKNPGRWFGMAGIDNKKGMDDFYNNVKWGNKNDVVRTYQFKENTTVYFGKVDGGIGYQVYIPDHIKNVSEVLEWKKTYTLTKSR